MDINREEIVAEVTGQFESYEKALVANDVEALKGYFWDSPHALRFGVTEELYGADEISAFRANRKINFSDRKSIREAVVTLGPDLAITTLEFSVLVMGSPRHGRQTQVWVRFPGVGWRIVSAHVSHKVTPSTSAAFGDGAAAAFGAAASTYAGLPVPPEFRDGVAANLEVMGKIVAPLMAVELPEIEPAPRFIP